MDGGGEGGREGIGRVCAAVVVREQVLRGIAEDASKDHKRGDDGLCRIEVAHRCKVHSVRERIRRGYGS